MWSVVSVEVADPPDAPRAYVPPAPIGNLFWKFGTLNEAPLPPYEYPMTAKSPAYVVVE